MCRLYLKNYQCSKKVFCITISEELKLNKTQIANQFQLLFCCCVAETIFFHGLFCSCLELEAPHAIVSYTPCTYINVFFILFSNTFVCIAKNKVRSMKTDQNHMFSFSLKYIKHKQINKRKWLYEYATFRFHFFANQRREHKRFNIVIKLVKMSN